MGRSLWHVWLAVLALQAPASALAYTYCVDPTQNAAVQIATDDLHTCFNTEAARRWPTGLQPPDAPAILAGACKSVQSRLTELMAHCRPAYCTKPDEQSAVERAITEEQQCAAGQAKQLAPSGKTADVILGEAATACESATMKVIRLQIDHCDPPANFAGLKNDPGMADGLVFVQALLIRMTVSRELNYLRANKTPARAHKPPVR